MRQIRYTHATTQGRREYQEDRFGVEKFTTGTLIWVADGHGGEEASQYVHDHIRTVWRSKDNDDRKQQIKWVFENLNLNTREMEAGTTLSLAFITKDLIYVAVLGDSPVIIRTGTTSFIGPDHNARSNKAERIMAEERGGIYANGYIWNDTGDLGKGLQMTRALGDVDLAKILNREPEISVLPFGQEGDFTLVATDGVLDPSHYDANEVEVISGLIEKGDEAYDLVSRAVKIPTNDNATAILARVF
jgi:serine/threonine protein phosphatase PrpC